MTVLVVTDSSASVHPELLARSDVRVVPLHVLLDGADLRDGVDDIPVDVHDRAKVSTSGATPHDLGTAYRRALDDGADGVVAVHLSAGLSGTHASAVRAADEFGGAVRVIDSRSAAAGVGFVALAAARAAADGAGLGDAAAAAVAAAGRGRAFIVVSRLENLRRSGRIGAASSWLGTALSLKPLLALEEGRLVPRQRARTASAARAALVDAVTAEIGDGPATAVVHHVEDPAGANLMAEALAARLPGLRSTAVAPMGPVLAVHLGRGAVGVVLDVG